MTLGSFIISNTPSHTMRLQWGVEKTAMELRNILFQEEDKATYVSEMMNRIAKCDLTIWALNSPQCSLVAQQWR